MAMKRPNSMRNLDMAIRRMGSDEADFLSNRSLIVANEEVDLGSIKDVCIRLFAYRRM